jgi:hypothetical protein
MHFKRGPAKAPRANPEAALQVQVARFLMLTLPSDIEWTSSLAGAHLGVSQRSKMKAQGLRPGFPDLMFLIRRRTHFIELKAADGRLSPDQIRIHAAIHPDAIAVCRSVIEVRDALVRWGVELRPHTLG